MNINVVGNFSLIGAAKSWGLVLTNFALALKHLGHKIHCLTMNGQLNIDNRIRPYLVNEINPDYKTFTYDLPTNLNKINANEIYVMFGYESSILPLGWSDILKKYKVIVNTKQQQILFKRNGVDSVIVPLGYDPEKFNTQIDPLDLNNDSYKFLSIGIPHYRKGFDILLKAWADEFKPDEEVALVLKCDVIEKPSYWEINILDEIAKIKHKTAPIIHLTGECENMGKLYRACNCYVDTSRAEGFGLCPLEAFACGIPTIHPLTRTIPAPVACQYHTFNPKATIEEPNVNDLKRKMRNAFDMHDAFKPLSYMFLTSMTWGNAAKKLLKVMNIGDEFKEWIKKQNDIV